MSQTVQGVFKRTSSNTGILLDPARSFRPGAEEINVPAQFVSEFQLVNGATIVGEAQPDGRQLLLKKIQSVCGLSPEKFLKRIPFQNLSAINPEERFQIGLSESPAMRIIELIAPIGKGTRGMIVSPPKAGKTYILHLLAKTLHEQNPAAKIIVLLIDERPEEVTWFRRSVDAEVLASSSDQSLEEHTDLTELTLAHIRAEMECGNDVILLLDSITRMGRAFNLRGTKNGRTMSGGLDSRALEIPRRFFGLARNVENGGSVTILATALIDTNSRMDQLIFEEFKGTGNSEIMLNRQMSDERIFPAIEINSSSTRREELLFSEKEYDKITKLRRMLAGQQPKEAMLNMIKLIEKFPTNEELLNSL
jgi:transcription termination factor Rho